jgi:hypothetical protein
VSRLLQDIDSAMGTVTGAPNFDDKIGIQELRFTPGDIALAETGNPAFRALRIQGDGGDYTATFKAINRGQAAWRFCFRCHSMYFDGFSPNKGRCPAGGGHAAAGFVFFLPHEHAGPLGVNPTGASATIASRCSGLAIQPIKADVPLAVDIMHKALIFFSRTTIQGLVRINGASATSAEQCSGMERPIRAYVRQAADIMHKALTSNWISLPKTWFPSQPGRKCDKRALHPGNVIPTPMSLAYHGFRKASGSQSSTLNRGAVAPGRTRA